MPQDEKDLVPLTLRIPRAVHARLKDSAESEFRSLNHQIIMALSYYIDMHEHFGGVLPAPEHVRKSLPDTARNYPGWLAAPGGQRANKNR